MVAFCPVRSCGHFSPADVRVLSLNISTVLLYILTRTFIRLLPFPFFLPKLLKRLFFRLVLAAFICLYQQQLSTAVT